MKKEKIFKIFLNIPTLYTERLSLRAMHPIDAEDMFDYARRPEVTEYLLWSEHKNVRFTKDYLNYIQTRYKLGGFYDPDFHRRGLGSEGVRRVIEFGFEELSLNRIEARFMQGNEASFALMRSVGMTFEGYMRDLIFVKGSYRTVGISSILRSEYEKAKIKE